MIPEKQMDSPNVTHWVYAAGSTYGIVSHDEDAMFEEHPCMLSRDNYAPRWFYDNRIYAFLHDQSARFRIKEPNNKVNVVKCY